MKLFKWITKDTNINFLGAEKLTYGISIVAFVLSILVISFKGFNYGIDFAGGILMEIKSENQIPNYWRYRHRSNDSRRGR